MRMDASHQGVVENPVNESMKNNIADTIRTPRSAPNTIPNILSVPDETGDPQPKSRIIAFL